MPRIGSDSDKYCHRPRLTVYGFKRAVAISLVGHLAVFGLFSFSFGARMPMADYTRVYFWGDYLRRSDFSSVSAKERALVERSVFNRILIRNKNISEPVAANPYFKPAIACPQADKAVFVQKPLPPPVGHKKSKKQIMFYPALPYHFLLYFKDRQIAHIELAFRIFSGPGNSIIAVKRKISSGNLEADLLSMRYINHYLFIQQAAFEPNTWQAVEIDLSAKND